MKKSAVSLTLLSLMLIQICACTQTKTTTDTMADDNSDSSSISDTTEAAYIYPECDYNGEDFTILNGSNTWGIYS